MSGVGNRQSSFRPHDEVKTYKDLTAWQLAMDLAVDCWRLTRTFPREEIFGATSQICRAADSVPANIAEGYGRQSSGDYVRFLRVAQGSLKELETHLLLSVRKGFVNEPDVQVPLDLADRVGRLLRNLSRSIKVD